MSTAIVITSGKGGTGKTSLTGGVASCLAALGTSACATWISPWGSVTGR